nr:phospholipase D family protein [Calothrix sp. FACHB-1219]
MTSTLFELPSTSITPSFTRASNRVILNTGYLIDDNFNIDIEEVEHRNRFSTSLQKRGISIIKYSEPGEKARLHIKSYVGTEDSLPTALISTANLTNSSHQQVPQSRLARQSLSILNSLTKHFSNSSSLYQINLAVKIGNKNDIKDLTGIQEDVIKGINPQSRGNFFIGQDATASIIGDIKRASNNAEIVIASPYIDDPAIVNALQDASDRGAKVTLISSNPDSTARGATGGSKQGLSRAIQDLRSSGVDVFVPDKADPLLPHLKAFALHDKGKTIGYIGSHNITGAANRRESLDLLYRTDGNLANSLLSNLKDISGKYELQRLAGNQANKYGYNNAQLAPFFDTSGSSGTYILPSRHGVSHFYELALYNSARDMAGKDHLDIINKEGYATAAYRMKYVATHGGQLPTSIPDYVLNYDREMNTPGLGYYFNVWSISHGYGRLYKDESGTLPSIAGALGAVLDKSLGYYFGANAYTSDYIELLEEMNPMKDPTSLTQGSNKGVFESLLTFSTSFLLTTSIATLTYFTLGVPFSYISSEAFKSSIQGMIDIALMQGTSGFQDVKFIRAASTILSIGPEFLDPKYATSKTPTGETISRQQKIHEELTKRRIDGKVHLYETINGTVPSLTNIMYRKRAGYLFQNIVDPFIMDVINPYPVSLGTDGLLWKKMRTSLDKYREALYASPYLEYTGDPEKKDGKWIIKNMGYERAQNVAQALDELGYYLPANPLNWGWFGRNRSSTRDFITLAEVFSFTDLLSTFESIYFNNGFNSILARNEIVDMGSRKAAAAGRFISTITLPFTIMREGLSQLGNIISTYSVDGDVLNEYKKLKQIQTQMVRNGSLVWDGSTMTRKINPNNLDDLEVFFTQILEYQSHISPEISHSKLSPEEALKRQSREDALLDKARSHYSKQKNKIDRIRTEHGRQTITIDPLLNNKGKIGTFILLAIGASIAADDLMSSFQGASIWSQFWLSINHREAAPVEFTANRILPTSGLTTPLLSVGYTGAAIALASGLASRTMGAELERYSLDVSNPKVMETIQKVSHSAKFGIRESLENERYLVNLLTEKGIATPKGAWLKSFAFWSTGLLAGRFAFRWAAVGVLNAIKSIPFVGENLLGKGNLSPTENLALADILGSYRNEVIRRYHAGEYLTEGDRLSVYHAGIMLSRLPITKYNQGAGTTRVIAQQAPMQYFQFFVASSVKGADERIGKKGIVSLSFGMQSAPILGFNVSFSAPIAVNLDATNKLGFSLVYNDEPNNILNYLSAVGSLGGTLAIYTATVLGLLEGSIGLTKLFNKDNILLQELTEASNTVKTAAKSVYNGLESLVYFPNKGLNTVESMVKINTSFYSELFNEGTQSLSATGGKIHWGLRSLIDVSKLGVLALISHKVFSFVTDVFTDDENIINAGGWVGVLGAAAYSLGGKPIYTHIAPKTTGMRKFFNEVDNKVLRKVTAMKIPSLAIITAGMYLYTSSWFGLSVGMDTKIERDKLVQDPAQQWATIALGSSSIWLTTSIYNDFGKDVRSTAIAFDKVSSKIGYLEGNPLTWALQFHYRIKRYFYKSDLAKYKDLMNEYLIRFSDSPHSTLAADRAENNALGDSLDNLAKNRIDDIDEFLADSNLREDFFRVTDRTEFVNFAESTKRGPRVSRLTRYITAGFVGALATTFAINMLGTIHSNGSQGQAAVDAFYSSLNSKELLPQAIANVVRIVTKQDKMRYTSGDLYDQLIMNAKGQYRPLRGEKLINITDPSISRLNSILQTLVAPYIVNPQNTYQSILPFVGVTFRLRDKGLTATFYSQLQSANQDTSTAIYSMASSFYFKEALKSGSPLRLIIEQSMQKLGFTGGSLVDERTSASKIRALGIAIRTASAQLSPLDPKNRRRYTLPASESTMSLITQDSLLTLSLRERTRRTVELANQPLDSIISRMVDTLDPNMLINTSRNIDKSNLYKSLDSNISVINGNIFQDGFNANFLYHLFNPLGKISLRQITFSFDKNKKEMRANKTEIDETTEWLEYSSMYLDWNQAVNPGEFSFVGEVAKAGDAQISAWTGPFKPVAYAGLITVGGALGIGLLGHYFYGMDTAAVLKSSKMAKNLFTDPADNGRTFKFFIDKRVHSVDGASYSSQSLHIRRGNKTFVLSIPEGQSADSLLREAKSAIQSLQVEVQSMTDDLVLDIFNAHENINGGLGFWKGLRKDAVRDLLHGVYVSTLDNYIDRFFDTLDEVYVGDRSFGASVSRHFLDDTSKEAAKSVIKNKLQKDILELLDHELGNNPSANLLGRYKNLSSDAETIHYLSQLVIDKIGYLFQGIRNNLLVLEPEDLSGYSRRMEKVIEEYIGQHQVTRFGEIASAHVSPVKRIIGYKLTPGSGGEVQGEIPTLKRPKLGIMPTLGKIGGTITQSLGLIEGIDLWTAFTTLANTQDALGNNTTGDLRYQATHAGEAVLNSIQGILFSYALFRGGAALGSLGGSLLATGPIGIGIAVLTGIALIGGAVLFHKNISETWEKITQSDFAKGFFKIIGDMYQGAATGIGEGILGISNLLGKIPGLSPGKVTSFIGGGLSILSMLFTLSGPFKALANPGVLARGAMAGGLINAAISSIPGALPMMNNVSSWIHRKISSIPLLNWFLTPFESQLAWSSNQFYDPRAPFSSGTAQAAIANDWQRHLMAATDYTGARTKRLFLNASLYGDVYSTEPDLIKPIEAVFTIRPHNLIDLFLDKEFDVRSQYYNQSVIGRAIWYSYMFNAHNYREMIQVSKIMEYGNPKIKQVNNDIKASEEKEVKELKQKVINIDKGNTVNSHEGGVINKVLNKMQAFISNIGDKIRTFVYIPRNQAFNPALQANLQFLSINNLPVLETNKSINRTDGVVTLEEAISARNDLLILATRGQIHPLSTVQSGYST